MIAGLLVSDCTLNPLTVKVVKNADCCRRRNSLETMAATTGGLVMPMLQSTTVRTYRGSLSKYTE